MITGYSRKDRFDFQCDRVPEEEELDDEAVKRVHAGIKGVHHHTDNGRPLSNTTHKYFLPKSVLSSLEDLPWRLS